MPTSHALCTCEWATHQELPSASCLLSRAGHPALIDFIIAVVRETGRTLYEGGLWIVFGFAVAGALHVLIDPARLVKHLGSRSLGACVRASLLGAPIPLCSCGVLPAAMALRRKGASREATLSFLITTPEVGVDSVAITAAYFGPVMAVIRPVVATITGVVAGMLSLRLPDHGCERGSFAVDCHDHGEAPATGEISLPGRTRRKVRRAAHYAFVELFDDVGFWLLAAVLLTGTLGAILPADFFDRYFPSSIAAMAVMVLIGAPLYVCASASTPLAALFVAKGASAGAALVFLLVGPATNGATMMALRRMLGPGLMQLYLGTIVGVALAAGLVVDLLLPDLGQAVALRGPAGPELLAPLKILGAVSFAWLLLRSLHRTGVRPGLRDLATNARASLAWMRDLRLGPIVRSRPVQALAALWVVAALLGGFRRVSPGEEAVMQRFGALDGTPRAPGLLYAVPLVDTVSLVRTAQVRERPINFTLEPRSLEREADPDAPLYVTADENLMDVRAEVQFRVGDSVRYRLGVADPEAVLTAIARGQLVHALATHPIDAVYTRDRAEVEEWMLRRVRDDVETMGLGIDVGGVRLLDVHAPPKVHDAFRDVASAHEDRLNTIHQAEEYAAGVVAVARGEAEKTVDEAQAWALERRVRAHADAGRFLALSAAYRTAPETTETRMYIETAERVLPGARKVIRSARGGPQGYELWLRGDGTPVVPPPLAPPVTPAAAQPRRTIANMLGQNEDDDL